MKITQSTVAMQSQHASALLSSQKTTLRAWVGNRRPDFEGHRSNQAASDGVRLSLSAAGKARAHLSELPARPTETTQTDAVAQSNDAVRNDPRMRLLMDMVEAITGQPVRVFDARELQAGTSAASVPAQASTTTGSKQATTSAHTATAASSAPAGWGLEMDSHTVNAELETTQVIAQGVVQTADGQRINFSLQLQMSRAFVQTSSTSVRAGDAVRQDPLVINFGGTGVELSNTQFAFDLNADGQKENIAFVAGGSGFLALDKNGDGQINDGTELFGPKSGNGFADLAQYDQDGNHWIDENDAVYSQLRVWQRDASGQDQLTSLAQSGVGALYLGSVASPFSVNTTGNQTLGQVRSSGVFLYESGRVGALQQVDL
jgi:hypothetical protein